MTSRQYEELCRRFIAERFGIEITEVVSEHIPNPLRPGLPPYSHQIDHFWGTGNDICRYLNIGNAKWRTSARIDQPDILLLQQVKTDRPAPGPRRPLNGSPANAITSTAPCAGSTRTFGAWPRREAVPQPLASPN